MMLEQLNERIASLQKSISATQGLLNKLCDKRNLIKNDIDKEYTKKIPKNIKKISAKQWEWILSHYHGESAFHYEYAKNIFTKHSWYSSGFSPETKQFVFTIHKNSPFNRKKFFEFYDYAIKHLKPVTVKDFTTETGIQMHCYGLEEDMISVLYIKKNGSVKLYVGRYQGSKTFKNFREFFDWYTKIP